MKNRVQYAAYDSEDNFLDIGTAEEMLDALNKRPLYSSDKEQITTIAVEIYDQTKSLNTYKDYTEFMKKIDRMEWFFKKNGRKILMKDFIINWLLNGIALFIGIVVILDFISGAYWLSTIGVVPMVLFLIVFESLFLTFVEMFK